MSQLTLTLDDDLLVAAQAFAQRNGKQLDTLVAEWLQTVAQPTQPPTSQPLSPRIQRLVGSLKLPPDFDYRTELEAAITERFGQGL